MSTKPMLVSSVIAHLGICAGFSELCVLSFFFILLGWSKVGVRAMATIVKRWLIFDFE